MFARMHTLETTPEQHDRGLELVRDNLLPWLRESSGFRGLIRLAAPNRSKTLVITLWADEAAARQSAEAGDRLGKLISSAVGSTHVVREHFEVTFFDLEVSDDEHPS